MRKTVDEINTVIKRHDEENTVIKRHDEENTVIERHDEENTVIKRHDEENTVIERHDEENPVIERHDEESSVVERHDEVEAHSEDCNQLIEVQMADTVSLDKSVPGLTSDELSPRITHSDDEDTNADKVLYSTGGINHRVDLEPARLHILNCLAEAYRIHDQTLALPDSTDEPTKRQ
ncbi:hypothetical protein BDZ91DRAFT_802156 [Kalaharituber pfeilii]|nr:hypothetical protein BDZ91DRAFT_802156 [Kalaharituber pfeilii]